MNSLVNCVGVPVSGEDRFWNRETEVIRLIELLLAGNSVLLIAPRRVGKTSLMKEVERQLEGRFICLSADLQADQSPADVVTALSIETRRYRALWDKVTALFSNILRTFKDHVESLSISDLTLKFRDGLVGEDWRVKGSALLEVLNSADQEVVIFLDEVPVLVNRLLTDARGEITPEGRQAAETFLSWLREGALRYASRVHFVITGSIGLAPILHRAGLSATINHLTPFKLDPWDQPTAKGCLKALAKGAWVDFEPGACEEMVSRLGRCVPYHVQLYFSAALDLCKRRGVSDSLISKKDVTDAYDRELLGVRGHVQLAHYEERLKTVLGEELFTLAVAVLTAVSTSGPMTAAEIHDVCRQYDCHDRTSEEALREVLDVLQHDGYLELADGRYQFVYNLIRDWWRRRFGGFLPSPEEKE